MTKSLYLLRHSYAEKLSGKIDINRELTQQGLSVISSLGAKLREEKFKVDSIVCSPAVRTTQTAIFLTEQLGISENFIHYDKKIYDASVRELLEVVNSFSEEFKQVLLVGHNPAISFLGEYLTGEMIGHVRPGGLVTIHFKDFNWKEISQDTGDFSSYYHPLEAEKD